MGEIIFTLLLFIGVMAVTAVLFGGWVVVSIIRFIFRSVAGLAGQDHAGPHHRIAQVACRRDKCGAINPINARFCRRCGHEMPMSDAYTVRRAAMW